MSKSVLFLHGLGGSGEDWKNAVSLFEKHGWRCEAPTMFPHLRCRKSPPEALNNLGFNDWVKAASHYANQIEEEEGDKPLVIGHCLGGLIAQKLMEYGDVQGGIFINPIADETTRAQGQKHSSALGYATYLLTPQANKTPFHSIGLNWGFLNCIPSEKRSELISNLRYESSRLRAELANLETIAGNTAQIDVHNIAHPTLTIGCGKNRVVSSKSSQITARNWLYADIAGEYVEFEDLGHWIFESAQASNLYSHILDWSKNHIKQPVFSHAA